VRRGRVRVLLMLVVSKRCKGEEAHLLEVPVHVLGQLAEEHAEQGGEERAGEVEPLGAKVVAVVELAALERGEEEAVHHVAEEEGLLGVLPGRHRHVREHLLLEDLLGVVDAAVARQGRDGAAAADEVESDLRVRVEEERGGGGRVSTSSSRSERDEVRGRRGRRRTSRDWIGNASSRQGFMSSNISVSVRSYTMWSRMSLSGMMSSARKTTTIGMSARM